MRPLPRIPERSRLQAAFLQRRGGCWATGTGPIALGVIVSDLAMHATEAAAERAAIALADSRDLLAVRS